jgi:hypothetical protein
MRVVAEGGVAVSLRISTGGTSASPLLEKLYRGFREFAALDSFLFFQLFSFTL